jgi:hypothetical protein
MKLDGRLFLFGLPLVAIVMIALVQAKYGDLAPAPPMAIPDRTTQPVTPRRLAPQPTVLAPSAEPSPLPPGGVPVEPGQGRVPGLSDELLGDPLLSNDPIPMPELRPGLNPGA